MEGVKSGRELTRKRLQKSFGTTDFADTTDGHGSGSRHDLVGVCHGLERPTSWMTGLSDARIRTTLHGTHLRLVF